MSYCEGFVDTSSKIQQDFDEEGFNNQEKDVKYIGYHQNKDFNPNFRSQVTNFGWGNF